MLGTHHDLQLPGVLNNGPEVRQLRPHAQNLVQLLSANEKSVSEVTMSQSEVTMMPLLAIIRPVSILIKESVQKASV